MPVAHGPYCNALQIAFSRGYDEDVQLLLENGTNVDAKDGECDDYLQDVERGVCQNHGIDVEEVV